MAEGEQEDAWFRGHAARIVARVVAGLGPAGVRAIVVAGSAARGEAGVLLAGGREFPVADLDLYVVVRGPEEKMQLGERRHAVLRDLASAPIHTDVGILTPHDIASLPATIANLSFLREGRVVWGESGILESAPSVDAAAIPREDALLLVANRAAEELAALDGAQRRPNDDAAALSAYYRGVKTTTDLGLAILMARGRFETPYRGRGSRVREEIGRDPGLAAALPPGFPDAVEAAAAWKRSPRVDDLAGRVPGTEGYPEEAERDLRGRLAAVRGFLAWYAGPARDAIGSIERSERWASAGRAWARYGKRGLREAATAARRIAGGRARPSPRFAVQLAAVRLYLSAAGDGEPDEEKRAARLLPGGSRAVGRRGIVDETVRAWGREVMNWKTT